MARQRHHLPNPSTPTRELIAELAGTEDALRVIGGMGSSPGQRAVRRRQDEILRELHRRLHSTG